jgi:hypothetical protein
MLMARRVLLCLLPLLLFACGSPATAAQGVPGRLVPTAAPAGITPSPAATDPPPSPSPAAEATPIATPTPAPLPPPPPEFGYVRFSGLAAGTYAVHLHRICSGSQGYHLAYLPNLAVSAGGGGEIAVLAGDFGQGWCVIVYANRAQTLVAAYRPI